MAVSYFCFRGLWADEMLARQMRDPSSIWAVAARRPGYFRRAATASLPDAGGEEFVMKKRQRKWLCVSE
jgi:hypothetical protein